MATQSELIDQIKGALYLQSDYSLAQRWQVEPTRISQYRRDRLRLPIRFVEDIAEQTKGDTVILLKMLEIGRLERRGKGRDAAAEAFWRPNEKVNRYPPPWVERKHFFRRNR